MAVATSLRGWDPRLLCITDKYNFIVLIERIVMETMPSTSKQTQALVFAVPLNEDIQKLHKAVTFQLFGLCGPSRGQ